MAFKKSCMASRSGSCVASKKSCMATKNSCMASTKPSMASRKAFESTIKTRKPFIFCSCKIDMSSVYGIQENPNPTTKSHESVY